jgi:hypothetical protein
MKLEFVDTSSKSTQITNVMKIQRVEAEFFHADGRTDKTKLIGALAILRTRLETDAVSPLYLSYCHAVRHIRKSYYFATCCIVLSCDSKV